MDELLPWEERILFLSPCKQVFRENVVLLRVWLEHGIVAQRSLKVALT